MPATHWMIGLGLGAGILSGMFGIGGGLVIVPVLALVFAVDQKTAVGTSLFALMFPVGILGVLEYARRKEILYASGLWIALGLLAGAYLGALLVGKLSPLTMKRLYGVFLIVVGVYYLYSTRGK
ncbi:protein of unknown function DUF81 [Isosphaera pallida ATCC 43644]|uniref:Probable membrane transporter protein n=2 Tax=Isosphaera pallida TaxID=128 RepID=E8R2A9_ISOPI|nr:protein of unknown function DUF81 [Isosphaera pallida ATCC 43644]